MRRGGAGDASRIPHPASRQYLLAVRRNHGELGNLPVVEQLPPLFADRGGIAQVLLIHDLHERGVVRAEDELAHGCNLIKCPAWSLRNPSWAALSGRRGGYGARTGLCPSVTPPNIFFSTNPARLPSLDAPSA